ncbi:hypothetical protein Leryth_018440 [Lithospermum erythrorhizon]|nr:hypothetical protein Leryth_018440 [Lithospermum erythrorhizon]
MHAKPTTPFIFSLLLFHIFFILSFLATPSCCGSDSLIYCGCTPSKFTPGTPFESNVNSVLTSVVNSAASANYNNFKASLSGSKQNDVVYGMFQCQGDLATSNCRSCVRTAVSQLGNTCGVASGGVIQLDGCFVRYDNSSFVGVEDKTVVVDKCGPLIGYDSEALTHRQVVLTFLANQGAYFRIGGSGNVQGVAQCTQDLSVGECQDCLSNAIGRLRAECETSTSGDMFLGKCYARYSENGLPTPSGKKNKKDDDDDDDDLQKILAITFAIIFGVALLVIFISMWSRHLDKKYGK